MAKAKNSLKRQPDVQGLRAGVRGPGQPRKQPILNHTQLLNQAAVQKVENKYQVVTLRRDGYTMREIADILKVSITLVHNALHEVMHETILKYRESSEEARQLQVERLDGLLKIYTPLARGYEAIVADDKNPGVMRTVQVKPNLEAAKFILDIEARRAKLLALDVPETKKLDVTGIREYVGVDLDEV